MSLREKLVIFEVIGFSLPLNEGLFYSNIVLWLLCPWNGKWSPRGEVGVLTRNIPGAFRSIILMLANPVPLMLQCEI